MSRSFDGVDDYLRHGAAAVTTLTLTLACWVKFASNPASTQTAFGLFNSGTSTSERNCWRIGVNSSGVGVAEAGGTSGSAATATGPSAITAGTWGHLAGRFWSTVGRTAYVNGVAGTDNTTFKSATVDRTSVGVSDSSASPAKFFAGDVAYACVWNTDLNANEIAALALGVHPLNIRPDNIAAFYPLDGDDDPEPDRSQSLVTATRYNLTVTGPTKGTTGPPVQPYSRRWWSMAPHAPAAAGRTTKNTRSHPLGINVGVNWRVTGPAA